MAGTGEQGRDGYSLRCRAREAGAALLTQIGGVAGDMDAGAGHRPCCLRRGRAFDPSSHSLPSHDRKGARNAGLSACPWPHAVVSISPHERSRHEPPVARRSARGVSGLLCDNPGGHTPLTGIAGRLVLLSSAGDPRPVSRIIAAWASARRSTSRARTRPPLPAPRLMTLIRRPLQQGRDDKVYRPISSERLGTTFCLPTGP